MNFTEFKDWRAECLRALPKALDCAETNLCAAMASLQPRPRDANCLKTIHRCDLARMWLKRFGLTGVDSRQALISRGIRDALNLIFGYASRLGARLWLPGDVYPVYLEMAHANNLSCETFRTLPLPEVPHAANDGRIEYLLVANPLKPLGRFLNTDECRALETWVSDSPNRWLILDCVYDLGEVLNPTTVRLWSSGRALVLHSAAKGWLWPKTFGVTLVPFTLPALESLFRGASPSQADLNLGELFLSEASDLPRRVEEGLAQRRAILLSALPKEVRRGLIIEETDMAPGSYFFLVSANHEHLLERHNIISIPASVFGGKWHGSVLTSLGLRPVTAESGRMK